MRATKIDLKPRGVATARYSRQRRTSFQASSNGAAQKAMPIGNAVTTSAAVLDMMQRVAAGTVAPEVAAQSLSQMASGMQVISDFAMADKWRTLRTGFPEVVWGPGKTPHQIATLLHALGESQHSAIATRVPADVAADVRSMLPDAQYHDVARILSYRAPNSPHQKRRLPGTVAIISAGTSDIGVMEECRLVAQTMGCYCFKITDSGVAGLHRLLGNLEAVRAADVVIVVAGMDGALPSVVAGLVEAPVVAVPTSVGYGAAFGGVSPLLTALNTCSPGVSVVNIDNGFGAAMVAARILACTQKLSSGVTKTASERTTV